MRRHHSKLRMGSTRILASLIVTGIVTQTTVIMIARTVGVEDYGIYSIVVSIQLALGIAATFGMRVTMAKIVSQYSSSDASLIGGYVRLGFIMVTIATSVCALCYLGLSETIASRIYNEESISALIPFSALVVVATAYHATVFGIVQGEQKTPLVISLQIVPAILTLVLVLLFAPFWGLIGVLLAFFLGKGIVSALVIFRRRTIYFKPSESLPRTPSVRLREILNLCVPSMISSSLVAPIIWLGNTKLAISEGFPAMGLLAGGLFFFNVIQIIPQSVIIPLVPRVSSLHSRRQKDADRHSSSAMRNTMIILFPVVLAGCLFAEDLITLVFGQEFSTGGLIATYLLVTAFFAAIASILGGIIAGVGKMWHGLGSNLVWGISFITSVFLLVPTMGIEGMGISYLVSYLLHMTIHLGIVQRWCGTHLMNVRTLTIFTVGWLILCLVLSLGGVIQEYPLAKLAMLFTGLTTCVVLGRQDIRAFITGVIHTSGNPPNQL